MLASGQNNRLCQESSGKRWRDGERASINAQRPSSQRGRRGNKGEISEKCETWVESACHPDSRCHEPASRELSAHRVHGTTMHVHVPRSVRNIEPRPPPLVNVHLQARNLRLSITSSCTSSVREGVAFSGSPLFFVLQIFLSFEIYVQDILLYQNFTMILFAIDWKTRARKEDGKGWRMETLGGENGLIIVRVYLIEGRRR